MAIFRNAQPARRRTILHRERPEFYTTRAVATAEPAAGSGLAGSRVLVIAYAPIPPVAVCRGLDLETQ
jgi:hypothetical protein